MFAVYTKEEDEIESLWRKETFAKERCKELNDKGIKAFVEDFEMPFELDDKEICI